MNEARSFNTVTNCAKYLHYLKGLQAGNVAEVSAEAIAKETQILLQTVSEDLQKITGTKSETYKVPVLMTALDHYLGYDDVCSAVLVGIGNMGSAILSYRGFSDYGINIAAAFDRDSAVIGTEVGGKKILDIAKLKEICAQGNIMVGIIAVPAYEAQSVCDQLIDCGIQAIWNFAPTELKVPENVLVQNENIADSLLVLSGRIEQQLRKKA